MDHPDAGMTLREDNDDDEEDAERPFTADKYDQVNCSSMSTEMSEIHDFYRKNAEDRKRQQNGNKHSIEGLDRAVSKQQRTGYHPEITMETKVGR